MRNKKNQKKSIIVFDQESSSVLSRARANILLHGTPSKFQRYVSGSTF